MIRDIPSDINLEDLDLVWTTSVDSILFDSFPVASDEVEIQLQEKINSDEISSVESIESSSLSSTSAEHAKELLLGPAEQFLLSSLAIPDDIGHKKNEDSKSTAQQIPFLNLNEPDVLDFLPKLSESICSESHAPTLHRKETASVCALDELTFNTPQAVHEPFVAPILLSNFHPQYSIAPHNVAIPSHQTQYYAPQHNVTQQFADDQMPYASSMDANGGKKTNRSSKIYKLTQPSKFCHVCVRSGDQVRLAPCANVTSGSCRKSVCEKCFEKHGFAHEWNMASVNSAIISDMHNRIRDRLPKSAWTCFHCRSQCPTSAQCKIYARTNKRRHIILTQRKAAKERAAAAERNGTQGAIGKGRKKTVRSRG